MGRERINSSEKTETNSGKEIKMKIICLNGKLLSEMKDGEDPSKELAELTVFQI